MPVAFVLALPESRDVGAEAAAELDVALRTWSRVSCTSFRARYDGARTIAPGDDGVNAVFFHDTTWPAELEPGAIAQTIVTLDGNGKIHDADIHLNGVEHRFSLDGAPGTQDLRSVLVHELGHALGLGHSTDPRATMNASGSGLRWRSLEQDDRDGVCTLYPGSSGAPGCDVVPCPAGLVCVAGVCQRRGARADVCSPCTRVPGACEAAGDDARCIDIGEGATAGRVCGRACATDADCGAGFACRPTSEAGDRQCVSLDGCRSAANTCTKDADCTDSACRGGVCVGPGEPAAADAGATDAGVADAAPNPDAPIGPGGGGCDCATSRAHGDGPLSLALVAGAILSRLRRRSTRPATTAAAASAPAPDAPHAP